MHFVHHSRTGQPWDKPRDDTVGRAIAGERREAYDQRMKSARMSDAASAPSRPCRAACRSGRARGRCRAACARRGRRARAWRAVPPTPASMAATRRRGAASRPPAGNAAVRRVEVGPFGEGPEGPIAPEADELEHGYLLRAAHTARPISKSIFGKADRRAAHHPPGDTSRKSRDGGCSLQGVLDNSSSHDHRSIVFLCACA